MSEYSDSRDAALHDAPREKIREITRQYRTAMTKDEFAGRAKFDSDVQRVLNPVEECYERDRELAEELIRHVTYEAETPFIETALELAEAVLARGPR